MTEKRAPDLWPQTQKLIALALADDPDTARMAGNELLERLGWEAIPLTDGHQQKVVRRDG